MRIGFATRLLRNLALLVTGFVLSIDSGYALPFSPDSTSRESVKVTALGSRPTYTSLSQHSKDLTFQELDDGRLFTVFSTLDASFDDLNVNSSNFNRCNGPGRYHVVWSDKSSGKPGVCVSWDALRGEGNGHSYKPKVGGPVLGSDQGRYVVFESLATNLYQGKTINGTPNVVVHDRKWELTWLSMSNLPCLVPDGPSKLHELSDDGDKILLSSSATNLINNLEPQCTDSNGATADIFIRDGKTCLNPGLGECKTDVLFDAYGLHAGATTVDLLDDDSDRAAMTPDQSVVVFETMATVPIHFLPDVRGFVDIYRYTNKQFSLISQTQVALSTLTGRTIIKNVGGAADSNSYQPRVSSNGKLIVFESDATDLVIDPVTGNYVSTNGRRQIYMYDADTERVQLISLNTAGRAGNGTSQNAWISRDGRFIAFESNATDLVSGVTTSASIKNIFLRDRTLGQTFIVTPGRGGSGLDADADITFLGKSGLLVAFQTRASNAIASTATGAKTAGDTTQQDVYLAANSCPTDTDGDKTPDCLDTCPTDVGKTQPGQCGCGKLETDTDADATADCNDGCPTDATKSAAGSCGCGTPDTDTDNDTTPNCVDGCPLDPTKTSPGSCGCGVSDATDGDRDGTPDCSDFCPANPAKSQAGSCLCTDLNTNPGACGCNVAATDANGNGVADCLDPTAELTPNKPDLRVTKRPQGGSTPYRLVVTFSQFPAGSVTYESDLTCQGRKYSRKSPNTVQRFTNLNKGNCTFALRVSVGTGATKVTSKTFTTTVRIGGSAARR